MAKTRLQKHWARLLYFLCGYQRTSQDNATRDGELVVSVPMNGAITREYGQANKKESGHWRMYGDDFVDGLEQSGFAVEAISPNLSPRDYERYGLIQEKYYLCRKPTADATLVIQ